MAEKFSHTNDHGEAFMVDIGEKPSQKRIARAGGFIHLQPSTLKQIQSNENKKGDVLAVARIAGIQATKETSRLIPLCHNILLSKVVVDLQMEERGIRVISQVECFGKTGVEMEALTAVNISLLTLYDMCKAVDKNMELSEIKLLSKEKL
ncbi:MAG: cyclic pyranopterin monophosphate synthase MoaC [Spirochaetaceae bacterium]|jgi:cyclic pyranopterin phosphate synthase|nr:cyclic pyranopterin monophosphate synthase MoaC [Spirochaetaceae bacterium]